MESTTAVIDPVCGMPVNPASAIATEYDGRHFYFCETACADTFRDEPRRWIIQDPYVEGSVQLVQARDR